MKILISKQQGNDPARTLFHLFNLYSPHIHPGCECIFLWQCSRADSQHHRKVVLHNLLLHPFVEKVVPLVALKLRE
jgi:hypothetical protein